MRHPRLGTIDLNLLRTFDALFRHRSVNLAAGEIAVSPSAISHALSRLRQSFDDELFIKGPDGMVPTACATELAGPIGTALNHIRSALGPQDFDPATSNRQFKLRANEYISRLILPQVIRRIRQVAPGVSLVVDCDYSRGIADELDSSLIDMAVGTFANLPPRLESEILFDDRWRWVLRADHPALDGPLSAEELMKHPLLVVASTEAIISMEGTVHEGGVERLLVASKRFLETGEGGARYLNVKGSLIINSGDAVPAILAQTDLVSLLPERMALAIAANLNLVVLPFGDDESEFDHRVIWHRRNNDDPAISWLRSIFVEAALGMEAQGR
jgi:DNA-binding transcriptional LysR family regulator